MKLLPAFLHDRQRAYQPPTNGYEHTKEARIIRWGRELLKKGIRLREGGADPLEEEGELSLVATEHVVH